MADVDLDRFLDELRIPHELDLALSSNGPASPIDEKYQRLRDTQPPRATKPAAAAKTPAPRPHSATPSTSNRMEKQSPPSKHHKELLKRLNASQDFGSHKQDLSIVKLNPPPPKKPHNAEEAASDRMLSEYMQRIHQANQSIRVAWLQQIITLSGRGLIFWEGLGKKVCECYFFADPFNASVIHPAGKSKKEAAGAIVERGSDAFGDC